MKKTTTCLILLSLLTFVHYHHAESGGGKSNMQRYGLKQACIQYVIKGDMINGTQELCFDRYGAREVQIQHQTIKVMGMTQETKTATYTDFSEGGTIYTVDLKTNTGTKMENPMIKSLEGKDLKEVGKEMLVQMGGKKIGTGKVLGKECDIWEIKNMGTKAWVWNWINLKTETNMMGMNITIEATKISDDFDKKKLEKPDIEYKDMSEAMKGIDALKKQYQQK